MNLADSVLSFVVGAILVLIGVLYYLTDQEGKEFKQECEVKGGTVKLLYKDRICVSEDGRIL